jgi:hypothetical protein
MGCFADCDAILRLDDLCLLGTVSYYTMVVNPYKEDAG